MADNILDVFNDDAFGVVSLTDAINQQPFIPGRVGAVVDWMETGVPNTTIAIEQKSNTLSLVNPSPRGGVGETFAKVKRTILNVNIPHYQIDDAVYADEVQGVRAFGQPASVVETVMAKVNERMGEHTQLRMDPTLEFQRLGAVKGIIVNGDASTLLNLFTLFGVTQPTEKDFNLDSTANDGAVRTACADVVRRIAKALGGQPYRGVYGLCSDEFWDALIANTEVRSTYLNQEEARELRGGTAYQTLSYGGITFENYRGGTGTEEATSFITANKAHFFPVGVPGLFRTYYAPADYVETVNTNGLPRYAKQFRMPNDKGIFLELQSNALNICTRPRVLIQGKTT